MPMFRCLSYLVLSSLVRASPQPPPSGGSFLECPPSTASGYNLSPSATTSLDLSTYRVYPVDPTDAATNKNTLDKIVKIKGEEISSITQYGALDPEDGTFLWVVPLNEEERNKTFEIPSVASVISACNELGADCGLEIEEDFENGPSNASQSAAGEYHLTGRATKVDVDQRDEITFLSAFPFDCPRNFQLTDYDHEYVYDRSAGDKVTVYIVDEVNAHVHLHEEFRNINERSNRLGEPYGLSWAGPEYGRPANSRRYPDPKSPLEYSLQDSDHGTAVLSKLVGQNYGAAKNVRVVMVRRGPPQDRSISIIEQKFTMLRWVRDNWKERKDRGLAGDVGIGIISFSRGYVGRRVPTASLQTWVNELNGAVDDGLLPVAASGNDNALTNAEVFTYPQLFAGSSNWEQGKPDFTAIPVPQLLVVGGVNDLGQLSSFSRRANFVRQYAPCADVKVASPDGRDNVYSGTSFAAPTVAGIAAYFVGLSQSRARPPRQYRIDPSLSAREKVERLYSIMTSPAEVLGQSVGGLAKWPRNYVPGSPQYPDAIWNGMKSNQNPQCVAAPCGPCRVQ